MPCFILLPLPLLVNACGWSTFSDRTTNPLVLDYVKDHEFPERYRYQVLSTDAERRTIIFRFSNPEAPPGLQGPYVCGEPPPDALQAYANAITAAIKTNNNVSLDLGRNLATAAAPLLYRSQGLQFARGSFFNLCQARMNGVFASNPAEYISLWQQTNQLALQMVKAEIPALIEAAKRNPASVEVSNNSPGGAGGKPAVGADRKPAAGADGKPAAGADGKPAAGADGKPAAGADRTPPLTTAVAATANGASWRDLASRAPTPELKAAILQIADSYDQLSKAMQDAARQPTSH